MRKFLMTVLFLMAVFACINAYSSAASSAANNQRQTAAADISSR